MSEVALDTRRGREAEVREGRRDEAGRSESGTVSEGARGVVETPYTCVTTGKERGCGHGPSAKVAVSSPSERSATGLSCLNASFLLC